MSFPQGEPEGQKEGSVCKDTVGRGGIGFWPCGDIQHELSSGSAICRGSPGDDAEDKGVGTESSQKKVMSSEFVVRSERLKKRINTPNSELNPAAGPN